MSAQPASVMVVRLMGRIMAFAGSSIVGNIFCGIAAYFAIAAYYGWNMPTQPHATGTSPMLNSSGHSLLIIGGCLPLD